MSGIWRINIVAIGLSALAVIVGGCSRPNPEEEISVDPSGIDKLPGVEISDDDWPWWRGPNRDNVTYTTGVPTEWDESNRILWKAEVPGRGHASPVISRGRIFLATADESAETQSVVCYQRDTGKELWQTVVHKGGQEPLSRHKVSHASSTPATDGERVFATFLNDGSVWVTALDFEGHKLWQTNAGRFSPKFGYNPSPAIYDSFVIIAADHDDGGFLAALHRKTGDIVWRKNRPAEATYASPLVTDVGGEDQIVIAGAEIVAGYNPENGEELWRVPGTTKSVAGTMAAWGDCVLASGGYPGSETLSIRLSGRKPEVLWRTKQKSYVPSLLASEGTLFQVHDNGRMTALDVFTGKKLWQGRLPGADISASPVLADGRIYIVNEAGTCFVVEATREEFHLIAENELGNEAFATPAIVAGRIYQRIAKGHGSSRQEFLYCIGE